MIFSLIHIRENEEEKTNYVEVFKCLGAKTNRKKQTPCSRLTSLSSTVKTNKGI